MKNRIKTDCKNKKKILSVYFIIILFFYFIFVRLLVKTDDGNFLGIVNDPDFTYWGFLKERYLTLSGRTVSEFLLTFFYRRNIVFFKIISAAMLTYVAWILCKISDYFAKNKNNVKRYVLCCCAVFMMIVSCLNPSVFWLAGAFTYLWPLSGMFIFISLPLFFIIDEKVKPCQYIISFIFATLAASQEQAAAASIGIYVVLITFAFMKKKKVNLLLLIPLVPQIICTLFLLMSPGAHNRGDIEAEGFERFVNMNIFQKLFCGYSSFLSQCFFLSFFLMGILSILLVYSVVKNKKTRIVLYSFFGFIYAVINGTVLILERSPAQIIVRKAFISGKSSLSFSLLVIFGTLAFISIFVLTVKLIISSRETGLAVALCLAAGFGCAMVMSFSSSIFASGQRVYFFTNIFTSSAVVILFSSLKENRFVSGIFSASSVYAAGTFVLNCFAFSLFEHPLMG